MIKILLVVLGTVSLVLGIIGIFVPGLPTTPFLLVTAGLYLRSSTKLYTRLISNKLLGGYILKYSQNKGIDLKTKIYSILLMWAMILLSAFIFISNLNARIILIGVGIIGTFVMSILPTAKDK